MREWNNLLIYDNPRRKSELCKAKDFLTDWHKRWTDEIKDTPSFHRKLWEYTYIMQSLWERGCIKEGNRGLVFAVGTEPLPAAFAKHGCFITATDIFPEEGKKKGWENGNQLCFGIDSLNKRNIISDATLRKFISYQPADMNAIPKNLRDYDFNWSSCSFEHLGSIDKGLAFLENQLQTLKPGGWSVHTTEYNLTDAEKTLSTGNTVIFRQRDIEKIATRLRRKGHYVEEIDYSMGGLPQDFEVDVFPYEQKIHIKLKLNEYVVTSIGLIIRNGGKRKGFFSFFH